MTMNLSKAVVNSICKSLIKGKNANFKTFFATENQHRLHQFCTSFRSDRIIDKYKVTLCKPHKTSFNRHMSDGSGSSGDGKNVIENTTSVPKGNKVASNQSSKVYRSAEIPSQKIPITTEPLEQATSVGDTNPTSKDKNKISGESWRSINPAATKEVKQFYFDTLTLANKFHDAGLTRDQSVCIVEAFVEVLSTSIEHTTKTMVTKPEQEIMMQQLLAQIASVKKDMVILEKSEFTMLRNENEKQTAEIKHIKSYIQDEISKLQGHVKLDVNLERSRASEAHANNEKQLQMVRNKIDTDVANLKTTFEMYRNDVMRSCLGTVVSCAAIILAVMRLMG